MSVRLSCGLDSKEWGLLNFLFGVLMLQNPTASLGCSLLRLGEGKEGRGSEEPRASEGSRAAGGGGPSGRGLPVLLSGRPPGCCSPTASRAGSQVITAGGGLGRF